MNRQLRKLETPHNQTRHNQKHRANTNTRTLRKSKKFKENYERGKDSHTITKNHRMENR